MLNQDQVDNFSQKFDFSMCNPPFFENSDDRSAGTKSEMSCEGGEETFVKKMIQESQSEKTKNQITWFTTMLGRKQSFKNLKQYLQSIKEISRFERQNFCKVDKHDGGWHGRSPSPLLIRKNQLFEIVLNFKSKYFREIIYISPQNIYRERYFREIGKI
eukprot:TRINITY_DN5610_c0_g1_i8.p1 TRINITY_DN5610_c0_g1~~TRINITY_DN5610_c0_g1_i8.p1  ORF type:complete len:171 (-),score=14.90 TRINITY_DN5610_c0_g1_i8:273-749(-)